MFQCEPEAPLRTLEKVLKCRWLALEIEAIALEMLDELAM